MKIKEELVKRKLKPRDLFYLFRDYLKIEISERTFYYYLEDDFKKSENENLYKSGVKTIIREYDEFLKRILC